MILVIPDDTNLQDMALALRSRGYSVEHCEHHTYILTHTGDQPVVNTEQIGEVVQGLAASFDADLLALTEEEIAAEWYWAWEDGYTKTWNLYQFSDLLELHKRRWRRWEEHHNGHVCVVERVRDKYVMPRVREFLAELSGH